VADLGEKRLREIDQQIAMLRAFRRALLLNPPSAGAPHSAKFGRWTTAGWSSGDKT
jgi:hypothetical protein